MNTKRNIYLAILAMAGLAVTTGCSSNPPASSTASNDDNNIQMLRVLDTKVVGKPSWVSQPDAAAIVEMNDGPLPPNYVVVGLDKNRQITAVLVATKYSRNKFQSFRLLTGNLSESDEVALPGGEYEVAVDKDIKDYLIQRNIASTAGAPFPTNQLSSSQG